MSVANAALYSRNQMSDTIYDYVKECLQNAFENDSITYQDDNNELIGDLVAYSDVAYIYAAETLTDESDIDYNVLENYLIPIVERIKNETAYPTNRNES